MNSSLLFEFERMLDDEAKRVVKKMIKMYEEKIKLNKSYGEIVRMLIDKKYKYYNCEIELRSFRFLPDNLEPDDNNMYALTTSIENTKNHLLRYSDWCKNSIGDKDHRKVAKEMAKELIDYGINHQKTTKSFAELVATFMPTFFPTHNDSVDSRVVVLFIQEEFINAGYKVSSLIPFRLCKIDEF